jgi:hypothetical protein
VKTDFSLASCDSGCIHKSRRNSGFFRRFGDWRYGLKSLLITNRKGMKKQPRRDFGEQERSHRPRRQKVRLRSKNPQGPRTGGATWSQDLVPCSFLISHRFFVIVYRFVFFVWTLSVKRKWLCFISYHTPTFSRWTQTSASFNNKKSSEGRL